MLLQGLENPARNLHQVEADRFVDGIEPDLLQLVAVARHTVERVGVDRQEARVEPDRQMGDRKSVV